MEVGSRVGGRYELLAVLGSGGAGRVFRAHDLELGRDVAVKVLHPAVAGDARAVERLRTEARLAARVRHPNVVQVLDALLDDQPAIVLELVEGPVLADVVPAGGMDVEAALDLLGGLCAGVQAVHDAGLVHRDVTPRNVLLDGDVPRLTDLGIARIVDATSEQTTTLRGTTGYLAPEQARSADVTPAADVYALGCVAVHLLTGAPPFAADSPVGVVHQHLTAAPPDLARLRDDLPPGVAVAVSAAMAKDPADRPPSAAALAAALGRPVPDRVAPTVALPDGPVGNPPTGAPATRVLDGGDLPATRAVAGPSGGTRQRDRLLLVAVAGVVIGALLTAGVAWLVRQAASDDGPAVAVDDAAVSPEPSAEPEPSPSPEPEPQPEPDPEPEPEPEPATPQEVLATALDTVEETALGLREAERLDAEGLQRVRERLSDAREEAADQDWREVRKRIDELERDVSELGRDGRVDAEGEVALLRPLALAGAAVDELERAARGREDRDD